MSELTQRQIYLTKASKMIANEEGTCGIGIIAAMANNMLRFGFGMTPNLLKRMQHSTSEEVIRVYWEIVPILEKMVGAHRTFTPMYPNFPQQVASASEGELFMNAMMHYFGSYISDTTDKHVVILPEYEKQERPELSEFHNLRWIDLGDDEDFNKIFTRLAGSNSSLSESDKEILVWFAHNRDIKKLLPSAIPQKETLTFLIAATKAASCLTPLVKTATDVLRVAVAMSGGDVSLAAATKFRNFSNAERRFLLQCLNDCNGDIAEDMLRWRMRWVRLGEKLHPGDYVKRFVKAAAAFAEVRADKPTFKTFNSRVEAEIAEQRLAEATSLLMQRPGDFARRLHHILRSTPQPDFVVQRFLAVADKVSTPVLLQTWNRFAKPSNFRAFFPKGNVAKVQVTDKVIKPVQQEAATAVHEGIRSILVKRFSALAPLGKVFLAPEMANQIVPFSQRSASRALRTVARGSSFDLPEGDTIRFFLWWKNIEGQRVDVDLSASMLKSDWSYHSAVAYYNLREGNYGFHSGDIVDAPEGACEFIDTNLPQVVASGARYIVMSVLSYTGQPFSAMPECFAGWMMRQEPNSGEIFEPRTVEDKVDVTAATKGVVPILIDAVARKVIWADLGLKGLNVINNAYRNGSTFSHMARAIAEINKPTLFDLFSMHVEARGNVVATPGEADTVLALRDGTVTPFDVDTILSEYLA